MRAPPASGISRRAEAPLGSSIPCSGATASAAATGKTRDRPRFSSARAGAGSLRRGPRYNRRHAFQLVSSITDGLDVALPARVRAFVQMDPRKAMYVRDAQRIQPPKLLDEHRQVGRRAHVLNHVHAGTELDRSDPE